MVVINRKKRSQKNGGIQECVAMEQDVIVNSFDLLSNLGKSLEVVLTC